ncbi:MAG: resuscitation-promoting factor rpfe [Acidimicrobiia bacterium]|nr:resuscitation-promoting factor rpfe [Acidimicrobiia bacterium]
MPAPSTTVTTVAPAPPTAPAPTAPVRARVAAPPTTVAAPPAPTTTTPPATAGPADPNDPANWDRMAQCEAGGNWAINSGNGYFGGLQFSLTMWADVGGVGYPHEASREEQIKRGMVLQARGGWAQWPTCARSLGFL